jgi:pyruvate/2-oxoglutarate dehydrogenase complex dihydrolipoamide dehydrogenase (E3) component
MSLVDAYEVLIVGGGRPGQALAADLGSVGHRVAMIEQGMIGGTCINVGCIPTKTLAASAAVAELVSGQGSSGSASTVGRATWQACLPTSGPSCRDCRWWSWAGYFVA